MQSYIITKIIISILSLVVFFSIKKICDKHLSKILDKIADKEKKTWLEWINRIIWLFLFIAILFILLQYWGIEITPLLAGVGILSLVIGLALQSTLSNVFSGISLTIDETIRVGDLIELPEKNIIGKVEEINWRSTRIRTLENNIVYIPNSILSNSIIINYSQPIDEVNVWIEVGIGYFEDLERVEKITLEVAEEAQKSEWGSKDWKPKIYYHKFGDSNIYFYVVLRAKNFWCIKPLVHEFIKKLKKRYDEENIEISFPNVNVFLRKDKENYRLSL